MDDDSRKQHIKIREKRNKVKTKIINGNTNDGNILLPIGLRRFILFGYECDQFLRTYSFNFLPYIGIVIYIVFCIIKSLE